MKKINIYLKTTDFSDIYKQKNCMLSFIKTKLRVLLESQIPNPQGYFDPFFKFYNEDGFEIDPYKRPDEYLEGVIEKLKEAEEKFGNIPYFMNPNAGDGVYMGKINSKGMVVIKGGSGVDGVRTRYGGDWFEIKANSPDEQNLQKGRIDLEKDSSDTYLESPAADARIKAYLLYKNEIIYKAKEFVDTIKAKKGEKVKSTRDKYVEPDNTFVGDTDKQINRKERKDKSDLERRLRQKSKDPVGLPGGDTRELLKKQAELQAKYDKLKQRRGL